MKVKALTAILCGPPDAPIRYEEGDQFEWDGESEALHRLLDNGTLKTLRELPRVLDNGTLEGLDEFTSEDTEPEPEPGPDFAAMFVPQLREELKARNLPSSGRRAELLERLQAHRVGA